MFSPSTWFDASCWESTIAISIGTLLIWLGSWVLVFAGEIFDYAFDNTILTFGTLISPALSAINITWSAFRDISNIVIIGMFTFVAIMTILGSVDYGAKKMLARVLIVAVLINFSLLFAKLIIDISNFTASQFYQNASLTASAGSTTNISTNATGATFSNSTQSTAYGGSGNTSPDIAGAFIGYAGANSWGNTSATLTKLEAAQGGIMVLVYGVVISLMEIAAAIILFYGTFLLAARALTFMFLMITSSIAFASYLIPSSISQGFGTWWKLLFKNAVFAPLLVVLLWVTLQVAAAFAKNGGSLTTFLTSPTTQASYTPLFGYIVVIALLFISFKVSSSFASQVGGLNIGSSVFSRFASGSGSVGSRVGGFFRQQTLGRYAYNRQQDLIRQAQELQRDAGKAQASAATHAAAKNQPLADFAAQQAKRLQELAGKRAQQAARYGNMTNKNVGGVEGFGAAIDRRAKEVAKTAENLKLTKEQQDQIRKTAAENYVAGRQGEVTGQQAIVEDAKKNQAAVQQMVADQKKVLEEEREQAASQESAETKKQTDQDQAHDSAIKDLDKRIASAEQYQAGSAETIKIEREQRMAQKKSDFDQQAQRIKEAHAKVTEVQNKIGGLNGQKFQVDSNGNTIELSSNEADAKVAEASKNLDELKQKIKKTGEEVGKEALRASAEGAVRAIARNQGTFVERMGEVAGDSERVADAATKKYRSKQGREARLLQDLKDGMKDNEEGGRK